MRIDRVKIALTDALRIQSAEFWLRLGEPVEALLELERLPKRARKHPWAGKTFLLAMANARNRYR